MFRSDFEDLSNRVWKFMREAPFKPREETVTEGLLTHIHRDFRGTTVVSKASSADESKEGHDWLWAITSYDRKRTMHLRVQAKILFGSDKAGGGVAPHNRGKGTYAELGGSREKNQEALKQNKRLMRAVRVDQVPVYAFYNGEATPFGSAGTTGIPLACSRSPFERGTPARQGQSGTSSTSPLGVTMADARWVRYHLNNAAAAPSRYGRWTITPSLLSEGTVPWECLTCDLSSCSSTRPAPYALARARQAMHVAQSTGGATLGVSTRPQSWARLLLQGDAAAAWAAADILQVALNAPGDEPIDPELLFAEPPEPFDPDMESADGPELTVDDVPVTDTRPLDAPTFLVASILSEEDG